MANAPRGDNSLEFHVRRVGAGWVSSALVRRLQPGDMIRLAAPMGSMTLDRRSDPGHRLRRRRHRAGADQGADGGAGPATTGPAGCTSSSAPGTATTCTTWPSCNRLAARYPWLSVVPACSDDPDFAGEQGDISDVVARYGPWTTHDFFVSGSAPMVRATLRTLAEDEVPPPHIRYDTFGDL